MQLDDALGNVNRTVLLEAVRADVMVAVMESDELDSGHLFHADGTHPESLLELLSGAESVVLQNVLEQHPWRLVIRARCHSRIDVSLQLLRLWIKYNLCLNLQCLQQGTLNPINPSKANGKSCLCFPQLVELLRDQSQLPTGQPVRRQPKTRRLR